MAPARATDVSARLSPPLGLEDQRRIAALVAEARHQAARLEAVPRTAPLAHAVKARARALEGFLTGLETWSVAVARYAGERSALADTEVGEARDARAAELDVRLGALRADRARLEARREAELRAFATAQRLLQIRLSVL